MVQSEQVQDTSVEEKESYTRILRVRLQDLERLHIFFEKHGTRVSAEDRYLWFFFLCQSPDATNVEIENFQITQVVQEKLESPYRFVNYMYDIGWAESFDQESTENAKDFVRFWITGELCDVWEALKKIVP